MKTIGLIGGMSWESSIEYYRIINETVRDRLGGHHSARSLMYSVDFAEIKAQQHTGRWDAAGEVLAAAAAALERGGADFLVLCTNTMHKLCDSIESAVKIPLLHIADATGERVRESGIERVGLLATAFTMEQEFYRGRLAQRYGLQVLVPDQQERALVHQVIYDELCLGIINNDSRQRYLEIVGALLKKGAQGIILGCTEISLLINESDVPLPVFDTTRIHAITAVDFALQDERLRPA